VRVARSFGSALEGLRASENPLLEKLGKDVDWCARESVLSVVPRLAGLDGSAAEIVV
jgi:phosphosulfolactate phosphohydrolase-like enzyme